MGVRVAVGWSGGARRGPLGLARRALWLLVLGGLSCEASAPAVLPSNPGLADGESDCCCKPLDAHTQGVQCLWPGSEIVAGYTQVRRVVVKGGRAQAGAIVEDCAGYGLECIDGACSGTAFTPGDHDLCCAPAPDATGRIPCAEKGFDPAYTEVRHVRVSGGRLVTIGTDPCPTGYVCRDGACGLMTYDLLPAGDEDAQGPYAEP